MHEGLNLTRAQGARLGETCSLAYLAGMYGAYNQPAAGLRLLDEAQAHIDCTGERFYEPEIYRIKGDLLLQHVVPDTRQATACFRHALMVARQQQTKTWELRAAMSLSRLWQQQGKHADAQALLASVYGWFTEGWQTADLQEARVLLTT